MHRQAYQNQSSANHSGADWSLLKERLIYLPGAVIFIYGLWLSLTS